MHFNIIGVIFKGGGGFIRKYIGVIFIWVNTKAQSFFELKISVI